MTTPSSEYPLDEWIEIAKQCKLIGEDDFRKLCNLVKSYLMEESNVQPVSSPVTVCGDIHGQFYDLLELFKVGGELPNVSYVFMGDYVDRGYHGIETITYLFLLKARYPSKVTLLRGNHECRQITQHYGFYEETVSKYGNANPWKYCMETFDFLPIGALIDNRVLCVHGGISPDCPSIDSLRLIKRDVEVPIKGPLADILWSDPEADVEGWMLSERGAGWLFGPRVTKEFNHYNNLELVARSHQLVLEGYKYVFPDETLVTVWSAPNYTYRCGNVAAVMVLDENLNREFRIFQESPESSDQAPMMTPAYFL